MCKKLGALVNYLVYQHAIEALKVFACSVHLLVGLDSMPPDLFSNSFGQIGKKD
jgi:hypothetical protein